MFHVLLAIDAFDSWLLASASASASASANAAPTIATDTALANTYPQAHGAGTWGVLRILVISSYLLLLALIATYGVHRYWLVWLFYRHRKQQPRVTQHYLPHQLPLVTVQLPMFNESRVAQRIIDAACHLDYPADRLQIQVLDDSTPPPSPYTSPQDTSPTSSADIARQRCQYWASRGVNIQYIHRTNRVGYKAGALDAGLATATGELIAIFDADFVPPANFLQRTVHHFQSDDVGMVQTRWGHLNRGNSMLTRAQAMFLDGHFIVEHAARCRADRWFNFNGTAGIWRRQAIADAGGWQHDTLTEDVDLSYRAQLAGWRFIYLPRLACPAELPPEINAFKSQQHRWNKGSIQTARKLLPTLMRAKAPLGIKIEAFFHLTSPMVYLYIVLITLLFLPIILLNLRLAQDNSMFGYLLGSSLLMLGTCSAGVFYTVSQREQKRSVWATLLQMPAMMSIGIGIAVNNARGCIEALLGHESPFIRTPKFNPPHIYPHVYPHVATPDSSHTYSHASATQRLNDDHELAMDHIDNADKFDTADTDPDTNTINKFENFNAPNDMNDMNDIDDLDDADQSPASRLPSTKSMVIAVELAMAAYMLVCTYFAMQHKSAPISVPFLLLFASGYFYVGFTSLLALFQNRRAPRRPLIIQPS